MCCGELGEAGRSHSLWQQEQALGLVEDRDLQCQGEDGVCDSLLILEYLNMLLIFIMFIIGGGAKDDRNERIKLKRLASFSNMNFISFLASALVSVS